MTTLPKKVQEIADREIEKKMNRSFFWLDYFDTYIVDQSIKIDRLRKRSLQFIIAQGVSGVLMLLMKGSFLYSTFAALLWTCTCAFILHHTAYMIKSHRIEKIMRTFAEQVKHMDKLVGGR